MLHNPDHLPVSLNHVGLQGFSTAGATVEIAAAHNPQFEAVIAEGNYATLGDMATSTEPHNLTEGLLGLGIRLGYWISTGEDAANLNPLGAMPRIAPRPVLLVYGSYELSAGAQRLVDAYHSSAPDGPIRLWIVKGAGHGGYSDIAGLPVYSYQELSFFDCALLKRDCAQKAVERF